MKHLETGQTRSKRQSLNSCKLAAAQAMNAANANLSVSSLLLTLRLKCETSRNYSRCLRKACEAKISLQTCDWLQNYSGRQC